MINFTSFFQAANETPLKRWIPAFEESLEENFQKHVHGQLKNWMQWIADLPDVKDDNIDFTLPTIKIGNSDSLSDSQRMEFKEQLEQFKPWRKGPFELLGVHIDTEWRSDMKWERLIKHITPLKNRLVLDVGCGSGYHCWRMVGEGASMVVGIDPSQFFMMQYLTVKRFIKETPFHFLPLTMEQLPQPMKTFDSVFSMGVLYHRRSPIDHIMELRHSLRSGGELILETLVVEGEEGYSLMPKDTYGKMRNVWFIPSTKTLSMWLTRCGFLNIKVIDVTDTSLEEQRKTDWISGQSLDSFLHAKDQSLTIEGYPAPRRAVVVATAP
ncbi:MAG: tRNA 5-methoxyuridine(34)/uridine 5-oxyacetic acid(34) synthase CmoB [Pseudomonadales bacterium]|nr:tRNA 5-methoxyuridine(34)/uridine 5-oxyacetic acid(34) synthase CmoB [Pseudomonadales bacterium]